MQISSPNCVAQRCDQQRGQLEEYKKKKKKKKDNLSIQQNYHEWAWLLFSFSRPTCA